MILISPETEHPPRIAALWPISNFFNNNFMNSVPLRFSPKMSQVDKLARTTRQTAVLHNNTDESCTFTMTRFDRNFLHQERPYCEICF